MGILDEVNKQLEAMSPEEIAAEFAKIQEQRAKHQVKQKEYNAKPEVQAKRKAYSEEYRKKNPEAFVAKRKAYMQKPEVKERMKGYRTARNAKIKLLVAKAKELGLDKAPEAGQQPEAQ